MSIVGHELIIKDLKRLADARELPHASLFFGSRRTGKRLVATALAHYLESCECARTNIANGCECARPLSDVMLLAPQEKESIGVDEVRALQHFLSLRPNISPYRTAVVDGAEFLTTEAQNALLKLAEEPPQSALVILVSSDPDALLPTLRSRLQRFYFGSVGIVSVAEWLQDAHKVPATKAQEAAFASHGVPGLAWGMLFDENMRKVRSQAKDFLTGTPVARKEFLKGIAADESFRLDTFLESLLIEMGRGASKRPAEWHRAVGLRADAARFNLNPRLQLALLGNSLSS